MDGESLKSKMRQEDRVDISKTNSFDIVASFVESRSFNLKKAGRCLVVIVSKGKRAHEHGSKANCNRHVSHLQYGVSILELFICEPNNLRTNWGRSGEEALCQRRGGETVDHQLCRCDDLVLQACVASVSSSVPLTVASSNSSSYGTRQIVGRRDQWAHPRMIEIPPFVMSIRCNDVLLSNAQQSGITVPLVNTSVKITGVVIFFLYKWTKCFKQRHSATHAFWTFWKLKPDDHTDFQRSPVSHSGSSSSRVVLTPFDEAEVVNVDEADLDPIITAPETLHTCRDLRRARAAVLTRTGRRAEATVSSAVVGDSAGRRREDDHGRNPFSSLSMPSSEEEGQETRREDRSLAQASTQTSKRRNKKKAKVSQKVVAEPARENARAVGGYRLFSRREGFLGADDFEMMGHLMKVAVFNRPFSHTLGARTTARVITVALFCGQNNFFHLEHVLGTATVEDALSAVSRRSHQMQTELEQRTSSRLRPGLDEPDTGLESLLKFTRGPHRFFLHDYRTRNSALLTEADLKMTCNALISEARLSDQGYLLLECSLEVRYSIRCNPDFQLPAVEHALWTHESLEKLFETVEDAWDTALPSLIHRCVEGGMTVYTKTVTRKDPCVLPHFDISNVFVPQLFREQRNDYNSEAVVTLFYDIDVTRLPRLVTHVSEVNAVVPDRTLAAVAGAKQRSQIVLYDEFSLLKALLSDVSEIMCHLRELGYRKVGFGLNEIVFRTMPANSDPRTDLLPPLPLERHRMAVYGADLLCVLVRTQADSFLFCRRPDDQLERLNPAQYARSACMPILDALAATFGFNAGRHKHDVTISFTGFSPPAQQRNSGTLRFSWKLDFHSEDTFSEDVVHVDND